MAGAVRLSGEFLEQARALLGERCWSEDSSVMAPYVQDWRGRIRGHADLLAIPDTSEKVSQLLALCFRHRVAVTPQGGNTGLVGGGIPRGGVLLSTRRLDGVELCSGGDVLVAGAGAVLSDVQAAARRAGRLFALSLASEGSATIGGLVATNAGGVAVLRYGTMRQMVLGLEVVLADGRIWRGLRSLYKDNTGIDLKQVFIGSEGTLGVVTAASLRLFPLPREQELAWVSVAGPVEAIEFLGRMQQVFGGALTAFELIARRAVDLVESYIPGVSDPLGRVADGWRVLVELSFSSGAQAGRREFEQLLWEGHQSGSIGPAVLAGTEARRRALWRIRESIPEAQKRYGYSVKNDISLPVSCLAEFMEIAPVRIGEVCPGAEVIAFGHAGDGNLHYNIFASSDVMGDAGARGEFLEVSDDLVRVVNDLVVSMGGSISAEHGIGVLRRDELARVSGSVDLDLYRQLKLAFDRRGILNPGCVMI